MSRRTLPFVWASDLNAYIWVWDPERRVGHWEQYEPGVNSAPKGQWGPEVQLIREFRKDHPAATLAIIKYAPGQTGVALDPDRRDWNVHSRGEAWDRLADMTDAALRTCRLTVNAVFWMGNHNDGLRADHAALVNKDMGDLVRTSRARWGAGVNWIIGLPDDTAPYFAAVGEGLIELDHADPLMASFDTHHYATQPDGLHYDAASVVQLGRDFYQGWRELSRSRQLPPSREESIRRALSQF